MRVFTLLSATLLFLPVVRAQDNPAPRGPSPRLWRAAAVQEDGTVVIQIAEPVEQGGTEGGGPLEPGVKSLPANRVMAWHPLKKVALGKTVQAFRADGKPAEANAVLKALAKPNGVAVFLRTKDSDPASPEPFYLALLRAETIMLVVREKDLYPQEP